MLACIHINVCYIRYVLCPHQMMQLRSEVGIDLNWRFRDPGIRLIQEKNKPYGVDLIETGHLFVHESKTRLTQGPDSIQLGPGSGLIEYFLFNQNMVPDETCLSPPLLISIAFHTYLTQCIY